MCLFERWALSYVDHPDEAQLQWDLYVNLSGRDLLFPEQISLNVLLHCFDSGLSPQTFQSSSTLQSSS